MTHRVFHRLVGYDRVSERVAFEHEIPSAMLAYAKGVAAVAADDPDAVLCYHLDPYQARDIAGAIGVTADTDALNFYMEGCAEPLKVRA